MNQHMVLAKLPIAEGATFDSHAEEHNPCCQANTRVDLLRDINTWSADPTTKAIYWLNGMAGTGKSTIARSLAHMFSENSTLGATFFFKRGESDRTKITKFFSTMASQLIKRLPEIAVHVEIALNADPAIFTKTMREQFRKLIMDPLSKISDTTFVNRTVMIIVDALDECEREEDVKLIIDLISYSRTLQSPRLKVFLTSRPELPIRLGFEAINSIYQGFNLHEIASPVIEHDITTFLKHELDRVRYEYNRNVNVDRQISANWPNPSDIQKLVKMSFPLFISAATVCRFIADRKGGNPERKLWRVLAYQELQSSRLYATYMPVLEQLIVDTSPINREEMLQQFQEVVGSIILLENPLSTSALARLLEIALENILDILDLLHSVLRVPSSFEEPVKLLHLSFRDFLVDSERQKSSFWVDKKDVHQRLATKCLRIMQKSLRADVCGVQNPGTLQSSMTLERVNKSLTSETQYACKFWSHHLKEANASITDCDEVWEFLSSHFLHWLEALSWLGRASESLEVIRTIQSLLHVRIEYKQSAQFNANIF